MNLSLKCSLKYERLPSLNHWFEMLMVFLAFARRPHKRRRKARAARKVLSLCRKISPFLTAICAAFQRVAAVRTVAAKFSRSLEQLHENLVQTDAMFVRCVKPNCIMQKGGFFEDWKASLKKGKEQKGLIPCL